MHPQDKIKMAMIAEHGFCFNPVMVGNTTMVYTAGLFRTFGHPEIFVIGYQPQDAYNLIGMVYHRIKAGDRFADTMVIDDLFEGDLFAVRPILQSSTDENSGLGQRLVGEFPAVQLFFSDENCLFPWDEGCDHRCKKLQTGQLELAAELPVRQVRSLKLN
ncbi:DUF4262 domain-containing protein [Rhizobium sp. BK176]|uniref:DUF4262 domain-containing protein n=1 Tax=Rhizobium sp. BK176 TaxID=2587071 RepID=UPI002166C1B2|nr:DUF4262 domain-containing protein [Rhizobium sp. BK176]MCS4088477.1 hypothetical protein [Rhizobium sp. BK176]